MSIQEDMPEIPRIPPQTVKALTRMCAGTDGNSQRRIVQSPCLVDIDDEIFVIFTDGATAVLVQMDPLAEDLPELDSGEQIQESLNTMLRSFTGPSAVTYRDVDVGEIVHWAGEATKGCPKCEGKRTCMFPRLNTEAYGRESQEVFDTHGGHVNDVYLDRRRIQLPLSFLGVSEGYVDVILVDHPLKEADAPMFCGIALISDDWRIYTAGRTPPSAGSPARPVLDLKK